MEHLQLDLAAAPLRILAARNEKSRSELGRFLTKQVWTQQDRQSILSTLSQLLLDKECTVLIGRQLRPIVLDLLERNREAIQAGGQINHDLHERLCVAMSKLISSHPDVLPFALRYFKGTFPVFQRLFLESSDANPVRFGRRRMKLRDLMEAAFKFLQQNQSAFRELWDWSVCVPLLRSHDTLVRWYTANCLSLITSMNEEHKLSFLKKIFNSEELIHYRLKLLEEAQLQDVEKALVLVTPDTALWQREKEPPHTQGHIISGDLSAHVTAVCGVLLPRQYPAPTEQCSNNKHSLFEQEVVPQSFVLVESVSKNLQSLALAVASQSAVLLEGPIGCGKTSLVEHLAAMTGRKKSPHILKVQLGDQTDSKMLLGMYRCTDVPGEFIWQPGTLTQAVTMGHWILLEDIDYAPLDVISVLIPLLENRELLIPGRGDCLKVAPGFQFFATRRLFGCAGNWYRPHNSHATLLDKYWTRIHLENMDKTELKEVLQSKYPSLSSATDHLLDIYLKLTGDKHQSKSINYNGNEEVPMDISEARGDDKSPSLEGRELSLRDLLNWCNRISYSFDSSSSSTSLNIFQEALDCFTAMLSKQTSRLKMAEVIGSKLNISKKKAEYFCQLYKPEIVVNELEVEVGRARLLRMQNPAVQVQREKLTFAATRPASILMEQLAVCVSKGEPVLLVGETGTGKTSAVQYLAHITGHRLRVVNMNQQSDTADLLGGYKPVDHKLIWLPLREGFEELFTQTFSRKQNLTFLGHIQTCYRQKRWRDLLKLMQHVHKSALNKETKTSDAGLLLREKWEAFGLKLNHAHQQMKMTENALLFAFVEGTLAQAVKKGEWILLDEINLAAPETLECLSGLLEGCSGSLVLMDRGDTEPLTRHPDFRLFACMNPATDVGKKNLPQGIRNRLTELYVEELESKEDLQILIVDYLKGLNVNKNIVQGIINFYIAVRKESMNKLVDGTGHRPHYSLRTLCRALRFAASNPCHNIQRSLYEGFCLGFLTQLDRASHPLVQKLICQHVISSNIKTLLKQPIPEPKGGRLIQIEGYWISVGDKEPTIDETYILTPSVKLNLRDIVRVVSAGTYPVLIQGETSVGKTSLIRWLAAASGNHCVRINNHEHTDIQEYIGCYTSDASGKLVFKEGVLIDAMRKGYWIILDELNLAPTDVLEALNRLLDDNRELHITETQEVVKAHPRFILFATQNPPGLYGGRKVLSRAFRNRFVELHFDELPSTELETILHKRCSLPPSYCNKLVKVMQDLQSYRRGSSLFAGKQGFITLRDLFRWAERYRSVAQTEKEYDWLQHLANDGFMLLAGRVRKQEEVNVIQEVLGKHFKKKCCPQSLFSEDSVQKLLGKFSAQLSTFKSKFSHIVWTEDMRRLAILAGRALEFGEPILLVGDTGCGKTTICQVFAALANQKLYSVNCHLHMETSDFLGGLRPVRQRSKDKEEFDHSKLFEWHDGPLVLAMKEDGFFLLDEISLADDSVLERLNSVLEVEKTLVLAEKGSPEEDKKEVELLTAGKKFRILATMNPGGDFGKKELSPALRNRFTEIWCPQNKSRKDLIQIVKRNVHPGLSLGKINCQGTDIAELMMDFIDWLTSQEFGRRCVVSIRDILSWVNFMNVTRAENASKEGEEAISTVTSFVHAACLVYVDGIGSGTTSCGLDIAPLARKECLQFLTKKLSEVVQLTDSMKNKLRIYDKTKDKEFICMDNLCGIHPFFIPRGTVLQRQDASDYALNAGTTAMNAQRLLRAAKLNKPILLEGSPGVGKTSLVSAIAKASGNHLVRINLSEQTDITDLFGANLPVEGGKGGEFSWRDGPLLAALKAGHWIVLDELNLASQSVLEGLNACFDHRAEVYIPEIGMNFKVQHKKTKIFGCQNPYRQGGGRKGLPRSFLNRFTQVYVDPLSASDMEFIANTLFPAIEKSIIAKMVAFNKKIDQEVTLEKKWGQKGGPWEFNLRDLFRWCQLILVDQSPGGYDPSQHVYLVYGERMRSREDKEKVISVFKEVFGPSTAPYVGTRQFHITPYELQVGYSVLSRGSYIPQPSLRPLSLLHQSLKFLEPVMKCVQMNWMVILVGPTAVGKTSLVQLLAHLTGHTLKIMAMNSSMDTTELLGGFEQVDIIRPWRQLLKKVESTVSVLLRDSLLLNPEDAEVVLRAWSNFFLTYKPRTLGEVGKSITVEIVNKLEAVLLLVQRLNNKINSFSKAEFSKLVEEFRSFRLKLIQTVDGRSHGTFEWVDSMLVQALQSGDWLLMDNVNFCNPSVLDRLNALLEPGGILTVSERGVIDGSTPTIAPHPNFRLFLSMDPIHGEISRAMRNRGIEIYIPGERNEDSPDPLDLKLLLHSIGLVGDNLCDTLIAMHTETREVIAGSPTSSFSTFFHTATLIAQRLLRGLSVAKAFYGACWEVYVCAQQSPANRQQMSNLYLNREKRVFTETNLVSTGGKKSKNNSVLRMSIEFQKDPENYQSLSHEIVVHLAAFFEFCDSLILFWVQSSQVELPDANLVKILHSILWRDRFWKASDMVKVDSQGLTLLSLHWHWVSKHLVGGIPRLMIGYEEKCYKEVLSVSEHIQNCLGSPMGGFPNVRKVQKAMGRPFPFKDKLVVECFEQLNALSKSLSILELKPALGEDGRKDEIIRLRVAAAEYSLKKHLLQAWGLILRASHLEDVNTDTLKNLVNVQCLQLKTKGVSVGCSEKKHMENVVTCQPKAASLIPLARKVQLWPGMEYLAVLWQYKITTDCLARAFLGKDNNNQQRSLDHETSHHIAFCLKYTPCASQQLKSLWYLMDHEGSTEEMTSLWSDLINSTFTSFWSSTVTTDPEYWLTWKPLLDVEGKEISQHLDPSLKGPGLFNKAIFSKCFFEVLTRSCRSSPWDISGLSALSSSHVTLGEWEERAQQLKDISTILWTNMVVSTMAELRSTDSHLQWVMLYRPLLALAELVPAPWKQEYIRQCNRLPSKDRMAFHHVCRTLGDMIGQEVLPEEMLGFMLTCVRHLFGEGESRKDIPEVAERGSLWVYLGLSQVQAWLPQTQFDPAIKREYKLKYAKEELHQLECEWKTRNLLSQLHTGRDLEDEIVIQYSHPHIRTLRQRIQQLKEQISRLLRKQAFRPQMTSYESLIQDVHHYVTSIARMSSVQDLLTRLLHSFRAELSKSFQAIQNLLKEEVAWQQSQHQFRKQLMEEYSLFPDAVAPLQAAILQMQHGMRLVASEVYATLHSGLVCRDKLNSLVTSLLSFPSVGPTFPTYFSHADALCSIKMIEVLRGLKKVSLKHSVGHELEGKDQKSCPSQEQLLMNALLYLRSHVLCKGEMDQKTLMLFRHICQEIINEWDEQERCAQIKAEQENSLYRYKNKNHGTGLSEEEEEEREFRKQFPLHEKDFADIIAQPTLEEKMETEDESAKGTDKDVIFISQSSMQAVMLVHQQLCLNFARSLWYQQDLPSHQPKHYFSLFLACYQTGASLVTHFYPWMGSEVNDRLLGSQLLGSTLFYNTLFDEGTSDLALKPDGPYDFYQHPNIKEVRQCQPVLYDFTEEVNRLLKDWPEHPALMQLMVVMDRIRSFPLSSPLSKFLNGLEILLAKSQDWEENASRTLSLRKHLDLVSHLIIQWRKLELNCWSTSLDNTMKRHMEKSTKHWFSIYQMLEKHMQEQTEGKEECDRKMALTMLVSTLQAFIEGASLGEFHVRLQMLLVFHCHVLLMPQVEGKDSLCSVLWNLYHYYKQFSGRVQARIEELRSPLEKELKEFVKISKWNDVSFWAIKQSVEKTHRTLFKFMKKFEAVLSEPCRPSLVESTQEGQLDCLQKQPVADGEKTPIQSLNSILVQTLLARSGSTQTLLPESCRDIIPFPLEGLLQGRLLKLTKRMKNICIKIMKQSPLPDLVENLDHFTGDIISSVHELQSLAVDPNTDKEKQKSEVKHILLQKQRALSELFKYLIKIGLSYRKGLTWVRSNDLQNILHLHPLDLHSALSIVGNTQGLDTRLLAEISSSWDGCQKYFYRSLARHLRLQAEFLAPSKEIGVSIIDRCKGFSAHLMKTLIHQRSSLTALTEQWIILRNLLSCVQEIHSRLPGSHGYLVAFPPQDGVQQWTEKLQHLSMQSMIVLEQLSWFLQCCPKEQSLSSIDDKSRGDGLSTPHSGKTSSEVTEPTLGEASGAMPNTIPLELSYPSPVFGDYLPPGCRMRKSDQLWHNSVMKVTEMLTTMKAVKAEVDKIRQQACETLFHSWKHFEVCSSGLNCMSKVSTQLQDLESLFILPGTEAKQTEQQITLVKSLEYIREEINKAVVDFTAWKTHLISSKQEGNPISDEGFVEDFSAQMEIAIQAILFATQNLVERSNQKVQDGKEQATQQEEKTSMERLQPGLLTKLLEDDFWADVSSLHVQKIISTISELLERLKSYGEDCIAEKHKFFNQACSLLVRLMPMLSRYSDLILFHLTVSLATHRSTGKLLTVITHVFSELGQKGFCLPKELMEESAGEGASEFHDYEGGGIGEGEGLKDVSDQIENEEQVEDSHQKGQEKEKEDPDSKPDIKGEDNAIEMSEDFDGKMHDGELEKQEEDDEKSNNENEELDKQMGDLNGEQAEKLDERLWGDDEEEEEEDEDDSKAEETGPGMDEEDSELVAKDDNMDASNQNKDQKQRNKREEEGEGKADDDGQGKEKIHEQIDEREYDENEVDPYYGNQEKQPEAEPLDLPDDLNLDGAEKSDEEDKDEEGEANPLEIDEKPVDPEEAGCGTEGKDQEAIPDQSKEDQDEGLPEEGTSEDKMEEEKQAEAGTDDQEKDSVENSEENAAEEEEENKDTSKEASEENRVPTHQGLQPQEEEREIPEGDEEVPEGTERREHESTGQTGEESLQSEIALEQAGTASEKDQAKEEHGSGTADARQAEGHESKLMSRLASQKQSKRNTQSFKRKPGHADNERSMGDHSEHVHKRLRTVESTSSAEQEASKSQANVEEADAFEHIKQGSESYDAQTYDVASQEQQQSAQPLSSEQEENSEDASMEIDEQEDLRTVDTQELKPEEVKCGASTTQGNDETDMDTQPTKLEEDQDQRSDRSPTKMENEKQERSRESIIHTASEYFTDSTFQYIEKDVGELRQELERQLETWQNQEPGCPDEEKAAAEMWQQYLVLTSPLSQQLCEQLRLILEPTQAAKLKGDYRTGKRLNMRKVIPYIASQFRKDKIWLRRTKPSKRQYQICLAIDDSSSMIDNHTKQLAYESLAVIGNALALLEVGQIAVYSFGETVQLLHPFHEQFNDQSGTRILQFCKFQQKKTKIAQFLESSASMFAAAQQLSQNISSETAQLLLIVSDGRGLFLEGKDRVTAAVQTARNANIFVIFVILDNPNSRDSILDIKVPVFKGPGELPEIHSYIEEFPFPFYLILRDVNALPETLGDALRQWFELVTASDGP
ncbi:midasin [Gracilinanus agilis]|uniref:midasin n=1 Tax=Gracilinanus agilis TaxID=191870 RepID=UPI001CFE60AC|nr:midasin [Gracilinanus agilis]